MNKILGIEKAIIGVVHLPALPGSPKNSLSMEDILKHAIREAKIYYNAGFDGIIIENFGDIPFYPDKVGPETVAGMAHIASNIIRSVNVPVGIQVLRNDVKAGIAIANAVGGAFVRVNVLSEAVVTDVGLIQGQAYDVLRYRKSIGAENVKIFADIHVKHAMPLVKRDIEISSEDLALRCLADAIILTGSVTGKETDLKRVIDVRKNKNLENVPVIVGSGANKDNISEILELADGVIVATSLKVDGSPRNDLNPKRVKEFMDVVRSIKGVK